MSGKPVLCNGSVTARKSFFIEEMKEFECLMEQNQAEWLAYGKLIQ